MQFANYQKAALDIKSEIERLYEWEFLSEEEANCLNTDKLSAFFKSDVFERIKASGNVLREYKFMVEYPYKESTTIVQGIADCIFEEADGMVILDFKTDRVTDVSELADAYSLQLEVYKYAVEKIFGKKVKECILYSLHIGKSVTV